MNTHPERKQQFYKALKRSSKDNDVENISVSPKGAALSSGSITECVGLDNEDFIDNMSKDKNWKKVSFKRKGVNVASAFDSKVFKIADSARSKHTTLDSVF